MFLVDLLQRYVAARSLAPRSVDQLRVSVGRLSAFLERPAALKDFARGTLNPFVDWLLERNAPATAWGKRKDLLTLWRFAWAEELVPDAPLRIKPVSVPRKDPEAWTAVDVKKLLTAAEGLTDVLPGGIRLRDFMRACVLVIYSTGLRRSAAFALKRADLQPCGSIVAHWRTQKSNYSQCVTLQPDAVQACLALGDHERLLPWPWKSWRTFERRWNRLLKAAGLPTGRREYLQKLRRTAASLLEASQPGSASWFLGHSSPALAKKHYLDPRIVLASCRRTPPPLEDTR